jgi:hypothetical protein
MTKIDVTYHCGLPSPTHFTSLAESLVTDNSPIALAIWCLRVMNKQLRQNICHIGDPSLLNSEVEDLSRRLSDYVSGELRYACLNWAEQLSLIRVLTKELVDQLELFCKEHLLYWIEVLSLLNVLPSSISGLALAYSWCMVRAYHIHQPPSSCC